MLDFFRGMEERIVSGFITLGETAIVATLIKSFDPIQRKIEVNVAIKQIYIINFCQSQGFLHIFLSGSITMRAISLLLSFHKTIEIFLG